MTRGGMGQGASRAMGVAMASLALVLLILLLSPEPGRAASKAPAGSGHPTLKTVGIGVAPQMGRASTPCQPGEPPAFLGQGRRAEKRYCPNLSPRSHRELLLSEPVTNEAGDSLDVTAAIPGTVWFEEPNTWVTDCTLTFPVAGSGYMPCAYVNFYDAGWETSEKAPDTNVVEIAIYDACGTLIDSEVGEGWHVVGTEYTESGWHGSDHTEVPLAEPLECFGAWKMVFAYTQTFSDKETLTDSIEVPFAVMPGPRATGSCVPCR